MKRNIRIGLLLTIALAITVPFQVDGAQQKTLEGHMEGLNCVFQGHLCPVDNLDPHIALEPDFVLYRENVEYYLLLNIPRVVKAKYVGKPIRVTGEVQVKYKAINVDKLEVKRSGKYKMVWSKFSQASEWERWKKEFHEGRVFDH